jgi:putative transposase
MLKAVKIRIYPSSEQVHYISGLLGTCRFIYNNLLAYKINEYNINKHSVSFSELGKQLVNIKSEYEWIRLSHSKVLQQSLINLEKAYSAFFKNGAGFPKFKSKKDNTHSCRFPSDAFIGINGNRISLIKQLKDIHYKCSRKDEIYLNKNQNEVRSITLTRTNSNKYYLSILIDKPNKALPKPSNDVIGIDLGIKDFIIDSKGNHYENIKIRRNNEKNLIKLHRQLSKKQKNSKNRDKARIKLAKAYNKLHDIKQNYLHNISNKLLNENQVIVMEDLNIKGMLKNHNLAKAIQELSLYEFKNKLKYKSEWYGRDIIEIDRFYPSSKLCSCCAHKYKDLKLSEREWVCSSCGTKHDRDINAAINIENEGRRILKIGLSSPEFTLADYPLMDDKAEKPLKSNGRKKQEKNVISLKFIK